MASGLLRALRLAAGLAACLALPAAAGAQDLFSPVILVNDRAVTGYELDQRARLLEVFGTPGDLAAEARTQLVEERLKQQELDRVGAQLTEEGLQEALEDFATRAELPLDEFLGRLEQAGVSYETLRDYVAINVTWRDYIRARFGDRVEVTEEEVDQALAQESAGSAGIEVLLSEIIIPAPPGREGEVQAIAERISRSTSTAEFEGFAREYSATSSREQGGRLDWAPLANYPAPLQDILLGLAPGQVTPPLPLEGAVALLQLRDIREAAVPAAAPALVDYAQVRLPGGAAALPEAAAIAARVDSCTDLFGQGLPQQNVTRAEVPPAQLPPDAALDLAALDPNEITWGRTEQGGSVLVMTMLCARSYPLPEGVGDREAVSGAIRSRRLEDYSDALVADLRASAVIVGE